MLYAFVWCKYNIVYRTIVLLNMFELWSQWNNLRDLLELRASEMSGERGEVWI